MPRNAPEARLYGKEYQSREAPSHKPMGPLVAHFSRQKPPENKLYGSAFREKI